MSESSVNKNRNKKRKKSFLKNARKYAKKGCYGRGSELDADTYQYFVRIMEAYREGFDNDEDKIVFVNNVFEQTENSEINCSRNQVGCRVIEILLPFANDSVLIKYIEAFSPELRPLSNDRFASHILEALVVEASKRSKGEKTDTKTKSLFKGFVLKVSKFLLNNLEDYIWDTYGNHVTRTCIEQLVQIKDGECSEVVKEYSQRLIAWPQFNELCQMELTSGFLQILIKHLQKIDEDQLKIYLKKLIKETFKSDGPETGGFPKVFLSKSLIMLLETCIEVCSKKIFNKLYKNYFAGRLSRLAVTRNTNFAVQKLVQHCSEKEQFEEVFRELADHFKDIIEAGHTGIILALAKSCKSLSTLQGSFAQNLMKALNCWEPEERQQSFILCLSRFATFDKSIEQPAANIHKEKLNLHGTLVVQQLLSFNKPIKLVNSILSLDLTELKNLFCNTMGSHIADSYMKGEFVGEKSREKLVRKLLGTYQELASTKYGSRSFEALWNGAHLKLKLMIMEELSKKDASWTNTQFGQIISNKVNLALFKRSREDWKNSLNKVDKTEKILADILK
ncbi:unnamed protein product [Callosobruchus maculatus]|uniref:Nucleolar protein 9 n=1 Tax=Callosobruchus maculatus TaxID=64391 RepID=A0A653BZX2_CALMS|nr:unnamed protein product [Callosobruchus maculatus]VEN41139.1 unnamed protein product [Callosobruchus maculatus]